MGTSFGTRLEFCTNLPSTKTYKYNKIMSEEKLTRINKFLSEIGYCSRRAADKLIEQGRVKINGEVPFGQGNYGNLMKKLLKDDRNNE